MNEMRLLAIYVIIVNTILLGLTNTSWAKNINKEVHFILSLDRDTNYWAGPVARWEKAGGVQSMIVSFSSDVTNGIFHAPGTLVIDIADKIPNLIKNFEKPFGNASNAVRMFYQNGILIAHDRRNKKIVRCKTTIDSDWKDCPFTQMEQTKQFQSYVSKGAIRYLTLSDHELPMLISDNRFVKIRPKQNELDDCKLIENDTKCLHLKLPGNNGRIHTIYTYFVRNRMLYFFANSGDIGVYELDTNAVSFLYRNKYPNGKRISNQFYTSLSRDDDVFMGHYPTGDLFRFEPKLGALQRWSVEAPSNLEITSPAPEMQSLGFANGFYWAGLWPFGELYSGKIGEDGRVKWSKFKRLFDYPELINGQHPFEADLVSGGFNTKNTWGQRIDAITNCFSGLCISTSNKSGNLSGDEFRSIISEEIESQYGRIFYLKSKKIVCQFEPRDGQIHLSLRTVGDSVIVSDSKENKCITEDKNLALAVSRILSEDTLILGSDMFSNNGHYIQQVQRAAPQ